MRLSDIEAQETAVRALRSSIQRSSVAHAYLFTGPKSTGKTSAALAFAAALNCAEPTADGDACGVCFSCLRIEACSDADVQVISPDGNQTKMDQMQGMIKALSFAPLSGKYRVFIVEQADTLNSHSENAILKVLEEPPSYAVLMLLSSNPNSLLPTIRSRCLTVRFHRTGNERVEEVLRRRLDLPDEEVRAIAACSQGAIGRAFTMAASPAFMDERRSVLQELGSYLDGPSVLAIRTAEVFRKMAEPKKNDLDERTRVQRLAVYLEHVLSWYADLLALRVRGGNALLINADYSESLREMAGRYSTSGLQESIGAIMHTRWYIEGNITPQLALENMLLDLQPEA